MYSVTCCSASPPHIRACCYLVDLKSQYTSLLEQLKRSTQCFMHGWVLSSEKAYCHKSKLKVYELGFKKHLRTALICYPHLPNISPEERQIICHTFPSYVSLEVSTLKDTVLKKRQDPLPTYPSFGTLTFEILLIPGLYSWMLCTLLSQFLTLQCIQGYKDCL